MVDLAIRLLANSLIGACLLLACADDREAPFIPPPAAGHAWRLLATGEQFVDVWGTSNSEVFALGSMGTLLRYDGSTWTPFPAPPFNRGGGGIWGTSAQDIFLADLKSIYEYDGAHWKRVYSGFSRSIQDIWGTSDKDVFAVGVTDDWRGAILHYDGYTWNETRSETWGLNSIWGSSSTDVFAVGDEGTILHFDGIAWSLMASGTTDLLLGVWGSSDEDVFVVGSGALLHYDGVAWTPVDPDPGFLWGVGGTSSTDVYVVGESRPDPLWRWSGFILHYDGATWTRMPTWDAVGQISDLRAVWATSSDVFAVGGGFSLKSEAGAVILHGNATGWRSEATDLLHERWIELAGVGGSSDNDVYFVGHWRDGYTSYRHFDGSQFGPRVVDFGDLTGWSDVSVASPDAVFMIYRDGRRVGRLTDSGWSYWFLPYAEPASVWAVSGQLAFAVGGEGQIHGFDGSAWSPMVSGTMRDFYDVWGASEADVFAVGEAGTICHFDGAAWHVMLPETDKGLLAVWGSSGHDVFTVGETGTILHYDGAAWSQMANPMPADLRGVWGNSGTDVFAVGPGVMLHYDGRSWTLASNMLGGDKIWGHSGGDMYLIDSSRIFRYGPE